MRGAYGEVLEHSGSRHHFTQRRVHIRNAVYVTLVSSGVSSHFSANFSVYWHIL